MVGIGFPKCGTGSLAFFDCHSKIVFREAEPDFWDRRRTSYELKDYILPNASLTEMLIGQGTKNGVVKTRIIQVRRSLNRKNSNDY